ncbi:MAG: BrnT family toxin [bacterium]
MFIRQALILRPVADKIWHKHHVEEHEVYEIFENRPKYRKIENGDIEGEDLYGAYGQTDAGRYLSVFFIYKLNHDALAISARDMNKSERKQYGKK